MKRGIMNYGAKRVLVAVAVASATLSFGFANLTREKATVRLKVDCVGPVDCSQCLLLETRECVSLQQSLRRTATVTSSIAVVSLFLFLGTLYPTAKAPISLTTLSY